MDIQGVLHSRGFNRILDLSRAEKEGKYFEGTGALVLDRINGIAYVNLSERADQTIAEHWVQKLGYRVGIHTRPRNSARAPMHPARCGPKINGRSDQTALIT